MLKKDTHSAISVQPGVKQDLITVFFQVVSIGLSNPMTILGYMSLMMEIAGDVQGAHLVIAVMCGLTLASVLWRVFLGTCLITMRQQFGLGYLEKLQVLCPLCFFYFGISAWWRAWRFVFI
jgi:threonine/homoserine/homoserine lactone efflux protein